MAALSFITLWWYHNLPSYTCVIKYPDKSHLREKGHICVSYFQGTIHDDGKVLAIEVRSSWSCDIPCQKGETHKSSCWVNFLLCIQPKIHSINLVTTIPLKLAQRQTYQNNPHMRALSFNRYHQVGKLLTIQFARRAYVRMPWDKWRLCGAGLGCWDTRETSLCLGK